MNHDYAHCLDYEKGVCPVSCFRAELVEDYRARHIPVPVAWTHFKGTKECEVAQKRPTVVEYIERKAAIKALVDLTIYDNAPALNAAVESAFHNGREWIGGIRDALIEIGDVPAADVKPVVRGNLVETREPIDGHPTWYRKHLCCSVCGVQIRLESWTEERCFGAGTILRENEMPSFCPKCGADMRDDNNA